MPGGEKGGFDDLDIQAPTPNYSSPVLKLVDRPIHETRDSVVAAAVDACGAGRDAGRAWPRAGRLGGITAWRRPLRRGRRPGVDAADARAAGRAGRAAVGAGDRGGGVDVRHDQAAADPGRRPRCRGGDHPARPASARRAWPRGAGPLDAVRVVAGGLRSRVRLLRHGRDGPGPVAVGRRDSAAGARGGPRGRRPRPAAGAQHCLHGLEALVDRHGFGLARRHVCVSTVGPSPAAIRALAPLPARLAWSVHAADDGLRRALVPTTRHRMTELRDAFGEALAARGSSDRLMVECALIDGVNDGTDHADALAALLAPLPGGTRVNLIPYNLNEGLGPYGASFRPARPEAVAAFQRRILNAGAICTVRAARGDREAAACGQLAAGRGRPAP
eukprot:scaffold24729_cov117-Isochrysis_galbana.AAC.6